MSSPSLAEIIIANRRDRCPAELVLDFDSIQCNRETGHKGLHRDYGEGGAFAWKTITTKESN